MKVEPSAPRTQGGGAAKPSAAIDQHPIPSSARTPPPLRHYDAIVGVAMAIGWPKYFRTDLTIHDRRALEERDPSLAFAWIVSEPGTHIVVPEGRDRWGHGASEFVQSLVETGEPFRFFWWDGVGLREVPTPAELAERFREYEARRTAETSPEREQE